MYHNCSFQRFFSVVYYVKTFGLFLGEIMKLKWNPNESYPMSGEVGRFYAIKSNGWYRVGQHEYFFDDIPEDGIRIIVNPETREVEPETFKMKRSI